MNQSLVLRSAIETLLGALVVLCGPGAHPCRGIAQEVPVIPQVQLDDDPFDDVVPSNTAGRRQGQLRSDELVTKDAWQKKVQTHKPSLLPYRGNIVEACFDSRTVKTNCKFRVIVQPKAKRRWSLQFYDNNGVLLDLRAHAYTLPLAWGNSLVYPHYCQDESGCRVACYDLTSGRELWQIVFPAVQDSSSAPYVNRIRIERVSDQAIQVRGWETAQEYIAIVDVQSGEQLAYHRLRNGLAPTRCDDASAFANAFSWKPRRFVLSQAEGVCFDQGLSTLFHSLNHFTGDCDVHLDHNLSGSGFYTQFIREGELLMEEPFCPDSVFCAVGSSLYWVAYRTWKGVGCRIRSVDLSSGHQLWEAEATALGSWPAHAGTNHISIEADSRYVTILGLEHHAEYRGYREKFDRKTGKRVSHQLFTSVKPIVERLDLQVLKGVANREEALEAVEWLGGRVVRRGGPGGGRFGALLNERQKGHSGRPWSKHRSGNAALIGQRVQRSGFRVSILTGREVA